ncbi:hypothetical protein CC79DRAFT_1272135 [Sarocladium strictum]
MYTKSLLVAGLATVASAHIKMAEPVPYGAANLNNSPLLADGSDFPCKQRDGVYDAAGASNVFAQGSSQQLKFIGSAVHGGGSCQVSITTDAKPDANSVWKVIKSIEGGCPAKDTEGNLPDNANGEVPYSYGYTIPAELAAGNYTIAWTWQNKIGNRELYMNCGPLQVTGDKADDGLLDSLPDMFVANIGNGCETEHGTDVEYPNPGKDVDRFNGATSAFKGPVGSCAAPTGGSGGGNGGGNSPAPTTTEAASEPSAPAQQPSVPGGVFITAPDNGAPAPTEAPATPEPTPEEPVDKPVVTNPELPVDEPVEEPGSTEPAPETPGNGSGNAPSGGFAIGTACDQEGDWNCVGGSSFQRCASGAWSAVMALAQGVECSGGQSATLNMAAIKGKRSLRRASRII